MMGLADGAVIFVASSSSATAILLGVGAGAEGWGGADGGLLVLLVLLVPPHPDFNFADTLLSSPYGCASCDPDSVCF